MDADWRWGNPQRQHAASEALSLPLTKPAPVLIIEAGTLAGGLPRCGDGPSPVQSAHGVLSMKLWCALVVLGGGVAAPGHRFACADYTQGKVFVVDSGGRVEWSYAAPNANDIDRKRGRVGKER